MGNKTIDTATHINVSNWISLVDEGGNQQILMKIMSTRCARLLFVVVENRICMSDYTACLDKGSLV